MIGIFDSGIGGMTVVKGIMDTMPGYDIVYFGDTARTPYGTKSSRTVIEYSLENTAFLIGNGAKIIVMACNTASSVATEAVKAAFDIPVFEVVSPAVDLCLQTSRKGVIGVIGTRATIASGIYERKIKEKNPRAKVYCAACPLAGATCRGRLAEKTGNQDDYKKIPAPAESQADRHPDFGVHPLPRAQGCNSRQNRKKSQHYRLINGYCHAC
jgi:glutamate racemase